MTPRPPAGPLSFYDHHRQRYGDQPLCAGISAEFMVGDYGKTPQDGGVGSGGEFKITLMPLGRDDGMYPHLEAFGDATGSLTEAVRLGLLEQLAPLSAEGDYRRQFAERLVSIGIADRSDTSDYAGRVRLGNRDSLAWTGA